MSVVDEYTNDSKFTFEKRTKTIGGNCMKSLADNKRKL